MSVLVKMPIRQHLFNIKYRQWQKMVVLESFFIDFTLNGNPVKIDTFLEGFFISINFHVRHLWVSNRQIDLIS